MKPAQPASISWRPTVIGRHHAISCGHYLASAIGFKILSEGGNAVDAGVSMAIALAVLQPDVVSFGGVAPTLIYLKAERRVVSLAGLGWWPSATDVARLREAGGEHVPEGILRQVVPAAPATHVEALRRFGTISFEAAASPALELARDGFGMYPELRDSLLIHRDQIARYPENSAVFLPGGEVPQLGAILRQTDLARTLGRLIEAERRASGDRSAKLRAVHNYFYKGPIAQEIDQWHRANGGFMRAQDLADFEVPVEDSISTSFNGLEIHSCDTWCQGIVLLEALNILSHFDLKSLGHNSPAYLHTLTAALNLAFSDREHYVGDPRFINVPTATLLSEHYAAAQAKRIDANRAFAGMPEAGKVEGHHKESALTGASGSVPPAPDTIYGCVVDSSGNAMSITPSDTTYDSPMVAGLGFVPSTRGMQGRLQENHPCFVAPGRRPRLTPTPALALRDGEFHMAWGTPGGDVQCSSMLQVFLNTTIFGMTLQQAIEAPRVASFNFPNSFSPNTYLPARLCVENSIDAQTIASLKQLGHDIEQWPERSWSAGAVCAIQRASDTGLLHAGADPRRSAYAIAW